MEGELVVEGGETNISFSPRIQIREWWDGKLSYLTISM